MCGRVLTAVVVAILCGYSLFSQWACAQQRPKPEKTAVAPLPTAKELPTAKDLAFLLGKWETKIVVAPTELHPEGVQGSGVAEYRLFGQVIEGIRSSETTTGHHEEKDFILYNAAIKAYEVVSINAKGTYVEKTLSKFVDDYVVEYTGTMKEKEFVVRGKYKIVSENEVQYSSEINMERSGFKPFVEVLMTRVPVKN